jgi:hypothetical protein
MLAQFWPKSGPRWDALGSIDSRTNTPHQVDVFLPARQREELFIA